MPPKQWEPSSRVTLQGTVVYRFFKKWDQFVGRDGKPVQPGQRDEVALLLWDANWQGELEPYVIYVKIPEGVNCPDVKMGQTLEMNVERRKYGTDVVYNALSCQLVKNAA